MLSKSQARAFFVVGTAVCSVAFVGLTVDTLRRIPAQTNAAGLSEQVVQGKVLWDQNNCMGCHTLLGEGAYCAPELTRVYERRGPDFIRAMLRDPEAMYPGQRRMVQYDFTPEQIEAPPPAGAVRPRHVAWAEILRRTFGLDVLACPDCGGRLRLVATIADPRVIARILAHLGLPLEPPRPVPSRQPSWLPRDVS